MESDSSSLEMMGTKEKKNRKRLIVVVIVSLSILCSSLLIAILIIVTKDNQRAPNWEDDYAAASYLIESGNFSVDPCDNFYEFSCGNWSSTRPIPEFQGGVTVTTEMRKRIDDNLLKLLQRRMYVKNEDERVVKDVLKFFEACMDTDTINRTSIASLMKLLDEIGPSPLINSNWTPENFVWYEAVAKTLIRTAENRLLWFRLEPDYKNASRRIITLRPGAFSFSEPIDPTQVGNYKMFALQLISRLVNVDLNMTNIMVNATNDLVDFELQLLKFMTPDSEKISPTPRFTLKELSQRLPGVDWLKYMQIIMSKTMADFDRTVTENEEILLDDEGYVKKLIEFLKDNKNLRNAANYISYNVIANHYMVLPKPYLDYYVNYTKQHFNIETPTDRNLICLKELRDRFPSEITAHLYISHFFNEPDREKVKQVAEDVKMKFLSLIKDSTWMDEETKRRAHKKLNQLKFEIGYAEHLGNLTAVSELYSPVSKMYEMGDNAFENTLKLKSFSVYKTIKNYLFPVSNPLTKVAEVDALYSRSENALGVSAGMISRPYYFGTDASNFMQFGALGHIIGHEMGHAFDREGMKYNENGAWENWWTASSRAEYVKRTQCFVDQYTKYGFNGDRIIRENLADNIGLRISYYAYQKFIKQDVGFPNHETLAKFTPEQLFFLAHATIYCANVKKEILDLNKRSPNYLYATNDYRVIGPLSNFQEFFNAFNCKNVTSDSLMFNDKKCVMW